MFGIERCAWKKPCALDEHRTKFRVLVLYVHVYVLEKVRGERRRDGKLN